MRKPNQNGEFLIETHNSVQSPSLYTIYDLTQFFPSKKSLKRSELLAVVKHTVAGKNNTVHIINHEDTLSKSDAVKLAIAWFEGRVK